MSGVIMFDAIFSGLLFAVQSPPDYSPGFSFVPSGQDISIDYLSKIFGNVAGNLLYGTPGIIAELFYVFNFIALSVGLIILIYHIIFGTMHTASDGEVMGQKSHGARQLIQSVSCVGLLMPAASGYCLAQVLVMQLVIWGVGAADSLWNKTLDYLMAGNSIYDTFNGYQEGTGEDTAEDRIAERNNLVLLYRPAIEQLLQLKVCQEVRVSQFPGIPKKRYEINVYDNHNDAIQGKKTLNVGSQGGGIECGYMILDQLQGGEGRPDVQSQINTIMSVLNDENISGFGNNILLNKARDIAHQHNKAIIRVPAVGASSFDTCGYTGGAASSPLGMAGNDTSDKCLYDKLALFLAEKVPGIERSTAAEYDPKTPVEEERAFMEDIKPYGWLLAGNYYRMILRFESDPSARTPIPPVMEYYPVSVYNEEADIGKAQHQFGKCKEVAADHWAQYEEQSDEDMMPLSMKQVYADMQATANAMPKEVKEFNMTSNATHQLLHFLSYLRVSEKGGDPLEHLTVHGYNLMSKAVVGFQSTMATSIVVAGLSSFTFLGTGVPGIASAIVGSVLPIAYAINAFNYSQGALLGIYLPLIPFIIFLMAGLGWIVAVIESMVAAPLVALGLIMPDQQSHVLGRAEPAVMMILNLFLRPSLIILGFIASLILVYVGLSFLNLSFNTMIQFSGFMVDGMFGPMVLEFTYLAMSVTMVKKCFDLIHQVPDKVLLWIGDRSQHVGGADEALGAGKAGVETGSGHAGKISEGASSGPASQSQTLGAASKEASTYKSGDDKSGGNI